MDKETKHVVVTNVVVTNVDHVSYTEDELIEQDAAQWKRNQERLSQVSLAQLYESLLRVDNDYNDCDSVHNLKDMNKKLTSIKEEKTIYDGLIDD